MKKYRPHFLFFLLVATAGFTGTLQASEEINQDDAAALRKQGLVLPLEKILAVAQRLHRGRVIDVELERGRKQGQYIYEIEIVDSGGRVWEMKFNAADASLVSEAQEHP